MPLLTRQDLVDGPLCRISPNITEAKTAPAIAQVFGYDAFSVLPHTLASEIVRIHETGTGVAAMTAYFDAHLKPYYLMQAMLNYVDSSEWMSTATGFRTARELQTDKASADVYAQILRRHEKLRDAARQRALNQLHADKFKIGLETYPARETERRQRHFNYIGHNGKHNPKT